MAMAMVTAVDTDTADTVATDTARGLLMLRPSPATAMAATAMAGATVAMEDMATAVSMEDMEATAEATMARERLMLSLVT